MPVARRNSELLKNLLIRLLLRIEAPKRGGRQPFWYDICEFVFALTWNLYDITIRPSREAHEVFNNQ